MNLTGEAKTLISIGVVTVLLIVGAVYFLSKSPAPGDPDQGSTTPVEASKLIKEDSYKISTDSAKVTIVEFLDYECEACYAAHPIVKRILDEYKGQVNFVVRNFPNHFNSVLAAQSAEAAGEQGKFWEMYDKLFEKQKEWGEQKTPQTDKFMSYAQQIGLDMNKFKDSLDSNKFKNKIEADKSEALGLGVDATPTFYINGLKNVGVLPYDDWKKKIDAELSK